MTKPITVEIWSDLVCPWCYLGKRRFERALERFEHRDEVITRWRSFELDPRAMSGDPMTLPQRMVEVLHVPPEEAMRGITRLTDLAAAEGLEYDLCNARPVNSFDAHRLLRHAAAHGMDDPLRERLSSAYVREGVNLAERATLIRLAVEVGLDGTSVAEVLDGDAHTAGVRHDESDARRIGISSVPTFVIGGGSVVVGAPSTKGLHDALEQGWSEVNGRSGGDAHRER